MKTRKASDERMRCMTKESADRIICDYKNQIYGFALSKTGSIERAEELASRITL